MSPRLHRRNFLRGALAGTAALPLAGILSPRRARAAAPTRALFVYVPDGCIPDRWHANGTGTNFTVGEMCSPLSAIQQHCVFLDGLNMYAGGATHEGGVAKLLTGVGDVSLDVFLGQQLSGQTPHASIQLGVGANFQNGSGSMSFIGPGQEVKPDDDPLSAFDRLFGGVGDGGGGGEDLARRRKQSVIDAALGDLRSLRARVGTRERAKLDTHLESMRELEQRLTSDVAAACAVGGFNTGGFQTIATDYYPKTYEKEEHFRTVGELQMDLATLALSCGVTRVASLMWSHPVSPTHVLETGVGLGNHDASHFGNPDSATARDFITLKQWFMDRFVYLIDRLQSTPDEGGTLLDNTVVLLCSELGDSNLHDHRRVPFVLAGRAGGQLQTGRALDFRGSNGGDNETHTKLLVSIAQMMGVSIDSFGYTGHGQGPLPGL